MKLSFLSKIKLSRNKPWEWPSSSSHNKPLSYESNDITAMQLSPSSCSTNSSEPLTFSDQYDNTDDELLEVNINSIRRERLFFDMKNTRSILGVPSYHRHVMLVIDTKDPYMDFKRSMTEMVEAHRLRDWECIEELLGLYLGVNEKENHGFIIMAYIDLLVKIGSTSFSCTNDSFSSSFSSSSIMIKTA